MRKELARVRLKRQHAKRCLGLCLPCDPDNRLMARMHTIEIADGGSGTSVLRVNELIISDDPHGRLRSRPCARVQGSVELAAWGQNHRIAFDDFLAIDLAIGAKRHAAFRVINLEHFDSGGDHISGTHGRKEFQVLT